MLKQTVKLFLVEQISSSKLISSTKDFRFQLQGLWAITKTLEQSPSLW